jgi:hypothetical protein
VVFGITDVTVAASGFHQGFVSISNTSSGVNFRRQALTVVQRRSGTFVGIASSWVWNSSTDINMVNNAYTPTTGVTVLSTT